MNEKMGELRLRGLGVSDGIGYAPALLYNPELLPVPTGSCENIQQEQQTFLAACRSVKAQLLCNSEKAALCFWSSWRMCVASGRILRISWETMMIVTFCSRLMRRMSWYISFVMTGSRPVTGSSRSSSFFVAQSARRLKRSNLIMLVVPVAVAGVLLAVGLGVLVLLKKKL